MGEYGSDQTQTDSVFNTFRSQLTKPHEYGSLIIHEAIKRRHPDHHVTPVWNEKANLIDFADHGRATATLIRENDEFFAFRDYTPPRTRMEGGQGRLGEKVRFGLYDYEFNGNNFQVYHAAWYQNYQYGALDRANFILSPKDGLQGASHCPVADGLITAAGKWTSELHKEVYVFDGGFWSKSKTLWEAVQTANWDDVILDPNMKQAIIKDVEGFFDSRTVYEEYGVSWKRGVIFHGTPGCGKTISIKALMNTLQSRNVASLYVKTFQANQGPQYSIRTIFQKARVMAPCMLIFEDLDSLVVDKVRSYFLNEVDGLEKNDGILMIGSTNHLERLDPGISKRPSRFDRKYHYRLPSEKERILYCEYWKKKLQHKGDIDFHAGISKVVAQLTAGFSFAYLKELFVQTLLTFVGGNADVEDIDNGYDHFAEASREATLVERLKKDATDGEVTASTGAEASTEVAVSKDGNVKVSTEKETPKKPVLQMPEITIPQHLENNALMRVLHRHARALWKEMDNSTDEIHARKKVGNVDDLQAEFMSRIYGGGGFDEEEED